MSHGARSLLEAEEEDILVQLRKVPGIVEVREMDVTQPGERYLALRFEQPVDHGNPNGPVASGGFGDATNTFFAPGYYHAARW
ncbi:hypothetical protein LVJ94_39770 [Pendulispora rubella]|uniref:Uncharacterized protein n=1 Tax=Pendulispora rubella TaxID=2741070 RepID=A0ABZ2KWP1_9BACT